MAEKVVYIVKSGDTLYSIAKKYNTTVNHLVELNNITDPNYIVVGQEILISGEKDDDTQVLGAPVVSIFGVLSDGTGRTLYAGWPHWQKENTAKYEVRWYYDTGDAIGWIVGTTTEVTVRQSIYTPPEYALRVRLVMRAIAQEDKNNNIPWMSPWSEEKIHTYGEVPLVPNTLTNDNIKIDEMLQMTITMYDLDVNADIIEFQILKVDGLNSYLYHTGKATIKQINGDASLNVLSYSLKVSAGGTYKVRCRSVKGVDTSAWSEFSPEVSTRPNAPGAITVCRAQSETSVYLEWNAVASATKYDIEYTDDESNFDVTNCQTENDVTTPYRVITGLESGKTHYFRIRAKNDAGESAWSEVSSTAVGTKPTTPATWSSKSVASIGDILTLSWMHNVEDGSKQTAYRLETTVNGQTSTITVETSDEFHTFDTSVYSRDITLKWRVKTAGVTGEFCDDWSVERSITVYVKPEVSIGVMDTEGNLVEKLKSFPFYISAVTSPDTQKPIGYHVSVISNMAYNTVDNLGNDIFVKRGDEVYSNHIDADGALNLEISANNITLENNIKYTIKVIASLDSGLTAEASYGEYGEFQVAWTPDQYYPNAQIAIDINTLTASIRPYCQDKTGLEVEDTYVSVYRREFDGGFTEVAVNLDCALNTYVTDPHPALDYARYRLVAKSKSTGAIAYFDMPGVKVGEKSAVIQWDEDWSSFESMTEKLSTQPPWSGSLLKLSYNLDVSDKYNQDVSHVDYIGRKHSVSYHGTRIDETQSWNVDVPKTDKETIYTLRRLANWMGNVYVREPSGSGYWATVTVSFGSKHTELVIPVTINITRVEGGV